MESIYLCPNNNLQRGHEIIDFSICRLIAQLKIYPFVVTKMRIKDVGKLVECQGFKQSIYYFKRKETMFNDDDLFVIVYPVYYCKQIIIVKHSLLPLEIIN